MDKHFDAIKHLLDNKLYTELSNTLKLFRPQDLSGLLELYTESEVLMLFRLLPKELASETFVEMDSDMQQNLIEGFSDQELRDILDEMFLDDTVDIIEEMPANVVTRIINQTDNETRKLINQFLKFDKDTAGTIMTVEYVTLKEDWTVMQCFERIRREAVDKETIYTCYVTDTTRRLIGRITVKTLLLSGYDTVISSIMERDVIAVDTNMDKEQVAYTLSHYDLSALPVVDQEYRMVGIVTVDDALDVLEDEATEDITKMAAVLPSDEPYLEQSVFTIWKNRLPWLLILLVSATFTGIIINNYEVTLNSLSPLLFACIPMLMDTGGNSGGQSSMMVIRGIALGDVKFKHAGRILWKEIRVSIMLAIVLASVCFGKILLIDNLLFGYDYTVTIALVVSIALFATIVIAKIVGCMLPLIAKKCRLDPAVVASPFITTIVDALSLMIYCNLAVAMLG